MRGSGEFSISQESSSVPGNPPRSLHSSLQSAVALFCTFLFATCRKSESLTQRAQPVQLLSASVVAHCRHILVHIRPKVAQTHQGIRLRLVDECNSLLCRIVRNKDFVL